MHCLLTPGTCQKVLDTQIPSSERKKRPNLGVREIKISQIVYFIFVNSESYGYLTNMFSCNEKYILLSSMSFTERERHFLFPKNHALLAVKSLQLFTSMAEDHVIKQHIQA